MRRFGWLAGYWLVVTSAVLALPGMLMAYGRLLAPLGRVLLCPGEGGRRRRLAEAAGLAAGLLALGFQWVLFSRWAADLVRQTGAPELVTRFLLYGFGLGLACAIADGLAQAVSGTRK